MRSWPVFSNEAWLIVNVGWNMRWRKRYLRRRKCIGWVVNNGIDFDKDYDVRSIANYGDLVLFLWAKEIVCLASRLPTHVKCQFQDVWNVLFELLTIQVPLVPLRTVLLSCFVCSANYLVRGGTMKHSICVSNCFPYLLNHLHLCSAMSN